MNRWKDGHPPDDALSAHLDGETAGIERSAIEDHLRSCAACTRLLEDLGRLAEAGAAEPIPPVPAQLESRIRDQVRGMARGIAGRRSRRPAWFAPFPLAAAASAVLAVGALWVMRHEILPRPEPPPITSAPAVVQAPPPAAARPADQAPPAAALPPAAAPATGPEAESEAQGAQVPESAGEGALKNTPSPPAARQNAASEGKDSAKREALPRTLAPGVTDTDADDRGRNIATTSPGAVGGAERAQRSVSAEGLSQPMAQAREKAASGLTAEAVTTPPEEEADTSNVDARLAGGGRMVMLEAEKLGVTVTDRGDVKVRSGRYECLVRLEGPESSSAAEGARGGEIADLFSRAFSSEFRNLDDVLPAGSEGALRGAREWRTLSLYDGRGALVKSVSYPIAPSYELPAVVAGVQQGVLDLLRRRALQAIESACGPGPEALRSFR